MENVHWLVPLLVALISGAAVKLPIKKGGRPKKQEVLEETQEKQSVSKKPKKTQKSQDKDKDKDKDSHPYNPPQGGFDRFWNEYPRKVGKEKAKTSWKKIADDPELVETIIESVRQHKRTDQWNRDNGEYIPYPATFLNQHRWEDEVTTNDKYIQTHYSDEELLKLAVNLDE